MKSNHVYEIFLRSWYVNSYIDNDPQNNRQIVLSVSFNNQRRATTVKWNSAELFDHSTSDRCSAHKSVIAFSRHGSERQNGAALLLSNTLRAYLFYYSYLLRDKSCRGRLQCDEEAPGGWAGRHAHLFLQSGNVLSFSVILQVLDASRNLSELPHR